MTFYRCIDSIYNPPHRLLRVLFLPHRRRRSCCSLLPLDYRQCTEHGFRERERVPTITNYCQDLSCLFNSWTLAKPSFSAWLVPKSKNDQHTMIQDLRSKEWTNCHCLISNFLGNVLWRKWRGQRPGMATGIHGDWFISLKLSTEENLSCMGNIKVQQQRVRNELMGGQYLFSLSQLDSSRSGTAWQLDHHHV